MIFEFNVVSVVVAIYTGFDIDFDRDISVLLLIAAYLWV